MGKVSSGDITKRLLAWYRKHKRPLPWRETSDPYRIWVSEIMLQQTRVETVIPYYKNLLEKFPTIRALAQASADEVLKSWENMGYYARARHLHEAARKMVERFGGTLPDSPKEILSLPGIGEYTAGSILSIAFGKPVPAIDGNAKRVLCRLAAIRKDPNEPSVKRQLHEFAENLIPAEAPGDFNQAVMDLGATICTPGQPLCSSCPLADLCVARSKKLENVLPFREKANPLPHRTATAGILRNRRGEILLVQRPKKGLLGGLWKFPGGEKKSGESLKACLMRCLAEELGIEAAVREELISVDHGYSHFLITVHAFDCRLLKGKPRALGCADFRWLSPVDFSLLAFSKADREIMRVFR